MAHRHKMQARARGGRAEFAKGGGVATGEKGGGIYAGERGNVDNEARKSKTGPFKRGGVAVGKAFGGAVKGRADKRKRGGAVSKGFAFASGGKVWSGARSGIAGEKGMAAAVMTPSKLHGEMHDSTSKTAGDGSNYRSGHGDKAKHQYKAGGRVGLKRGGRAEGGRSDAPFSERGAMSTPRQEDPHGKYDTQPSGEGGGPYGGAFNEPRGARGGKVHKKQGGPVKAFKHGDKAEKKDDDEDDGDADEDDGDDHEDDPGYKRGGKLQMHYVGGKGKRHKRQTGGGVNESGLADEGE